MTPARREELLNGYLDGTLGGAEHDQVARLVARDPEWAREFEEMRRLAAGTEPRLIHFLSRRISARGSTKSRNGPLSRGPGTRMR